MKSILFLFSLIIIFTTAKATNYYFSAVSGEDSRTPFQARNPATPWKSLARLTSFSSNFKPGDSVLLKRRETFYGSIIIKSSGTFNLPIVIGAYGSGAKPVISGFTPLNWSPVKNNIYESQVLSPATVNVVTINGSLQGMGRYPNTGYLNLESHSGTSSLSDNELTGSPNFTGAELVLRSRRWVLDRNLITNHEGNTINYATSSKYEPKNKYGYFIQNSPLTLDMPGEWYYNPSTNKIWLYSKDEPKNANASSIDNIITCSGNSNVTFYNLEIQGANKNGFTITSGSNVNILYCDILFSGEYGLKLFNHKGFKMEYSLIANSLNNGIDLSSNCGYAVLRNNVIQNTATIPGGGKSGDYMGLAIFTKSSNNLIEYNKVTNTGYVPIFLGGDSAIIKNNYVDSFCIVKDDGGGIYSYIGGGKRRLGRKITGNIILNGIGAPAGTDNPRQSAATGIYLDDNSSDIEITGNTVSRCNNQGIFIQNTFSVDISNNTFYDNRVQISMIQRPDKLVRDNIIAQNIFFSKVPAQTMLFFQSAAADVDLFAKFTNNYYVKPADNSLIVYNSKQNGTPNSELAGWTKKYGRDENSKANNVAAVTNPNYVIRFEYNPTKSDKTVTLDGNYTDLKNNQYPNTIVLKPYTSAILIKQK